MTREPWRSKLLAIVLPCVAAIGAGCIPVPAGDRQHDDRPRPERLIGDAGSAAPLVMNRSTRLEVMEVLGPPTEVWEGGRVWAHRYDVILIKFHSVIGRIDYHERRWLFTAYRPDGVIEKRWLEKGDVLPDGLRERG